ncbi:acetyltransferase [Trichophyton mentagrophytes]|uniref:Wax synthase domain-containing protein n=2 Tax=Trichophyton TaxID=5550 RepID=A0A059IY04_TRIIM|nr:hypothetical protein TESG_04169 [Trichophyton tonsurans CBS 112818]EZF28983.1 hypothetical protein H101_07329 [Trichophyton interdigitale H6]KAG5205956.1 putative Toxin biosynthesis protein (Tri7) [Trichophyton interdigitale]KDB20511.1 hypothetical protein H109_07538 [Trichophyton interdigitale MR816]GBF61764.1 acetyltransferase [Trichophyton mentagrophytes]
MEIHPILLGGAVFASSALAVGFTRPSSIYRLAVAPILTFSTFKCITTSMDYMIRCPWAGLVGAYTITFYLHYLDIVLLRGWSFEAGGPSTDPGTGKNIPNYPKKDQTDNTWERLKFGLAATCSFRHIGTPYQVKNVPRFSEKDPEYIPSRSRFLIWTAFLYAACYIFLDLITFKVDIDTNLKYFTQKNVPFFTRLPDISGDEIVMRVINTIISGLIMICVQRSFYSLVGFFSVLLGISEPREWPPYFGSLSQAFTLRRTWAVFWQQTNAAKFASVSSFIVQRVLRISRGTQLYRYARLVSIFAVSASMHVLVDVASGLSLTSSGAARFFLTQAFGIMIEDIIIGLYYNFLVKDRSRERYLLEKCVGFVWVGAFMIWSSPAYVYPLMYRVNSGQDDSIIPFSIIKMLIPVR